MDIAFKTLARHRRVKPVFACACRAGLVVLAFMVESFGVCLNIASAEGVNDSAPKSNSGSLTDPRGPHIDASQQSGINTYSAGSFARRNTQPGFMSNTRSMVKHGHVRSYPGRAAVHTAKSASASSKNGAIDKQALDYFNKGNQSSNKGEKELAGFFYEKALAAISQQKNVDQKFKQQVENALSRVNQE